MEKSTKKDLVTAAVAGGIGASCFAIGPEISSFLGTYGQDIASLVSVILDLCGIGGLMAAAVKLGPLAVKIAKKIIESVKSKEKDKTQAKTQQKTQEKSNSRTAQKELRATLKQTSVAPQISAPKAQTVQKTQLPTAAVKSRSGERAA